MDETQDTTSPLAKAKRAVAEELHRQGTPEYDPRSLERLVEAERKAADQLAREADTDR